MQVDFGSKALGSPGAHEPPIQSWLPYATARAPQDANLQQELESMDSQYWELRVRAHKIVTSSGGAQLGN